MAVSATSSKDVFPSDFLWSVATASYQIEGAWNIDGKGENIWDRYSHEKLEANGDVACDSYQHYEQDVQMIKECGFTAYRFSISWARILPEGKISKINQSGVEYYMKVITALVDAGIEPIITLYHWDFPQALQDEGGWQNEQSIEWFNDYANLCFQTFGQQVKKWITINEPQVFITQGYDVNGLFAPSVRDTGSVVYKVAHNILRAHSRAYHTYHSLNRDFNDGGQIGISLNCTWRVPKDKTSAIDQEAAERHLQFEFGWFAHPMFINGQYPDVMREMLGDRLPRFTEDESKSLLGSSDFLGINYYTARLTSAIEADSSGTPGSYEADVGTKQECDSSWIGTSSPWLKVAAFGLAEVLRWVDRTYNHPCMFITENGVCDDSGALEDQHRIDFIHSHIDAVHQAMSEGCHVIGYTVWSLMDNFEWTDGYTQKFGIYSVDFDDPFRKRSAKNSAKWIRTFLRRE